MRCQKEITSLLFSFFCFALFRFLFGIRNLRHTLYKCYNNCLQRYETVYRYGDSLTSKHFSAVYTFKLLHAGF